MALSWQNPSLNAGFYGNPQYSVEAVGTGIVRLRGILVGLPNDVDAGAPKVAWTMPAGARPFQRTRLLSVEASGRHPVVITIETNGDLWIGQEPPPNNYWQPMPVSLDQLTYCGEA